MACLDEKTAVFQRFTWNLKMERKGKTTGLSWIFIGINLTAVSPCALSLALKHYLNVFCIVPEFIREGPS